MFLLSERNFSMKTLYFECKMGAAETCSWSPFMKYATRKELFLQTMNQAFSEYGIQISAEESKSAAFRHTYACYDKRRRGRRACT